LENCTAAFTQSGGLRTHFRTHTGEKPYVCIWNDCTLGFAQKGDLSAHLRTHNGEKPYKCHWNDCNAAFRQAGVLTKHLRTHSGEKPHLCFWENCKASFARSSALTVHLRTHTGEKPYRCSFDECKAAFSVSGSLKTHHVTSHTVAGILRQKKEENALAKAMDTASIYYKREHHVNMSCINNEENKFVRVDFMVLAKGGIIFIEVDEAQHAGYPVLCDSIRPWKIAESLSLEGNSLPILFIRFNPNKFEIGEKVQKVSKRDRYRALCEYIKQLNMETCAPLSVKYMFYDQNLDQVPIVTLDSEFAKQTIEILV